MDFKKTAYTVIDEFKQVMNRMDGQAVEDFIALMKQSKRVFFIGVGREGMMTRAFAMRVMHMGWEAHWIWDDTTPNIGTGDLLVATMGGGSIGHIEYVVGRARENGARVAVVTGDRRGAGVALADLVLFIPGAVYRGSDDVVASVQPMGNLFEQCLLLVFDLICMKMVDEDSGITYTEMEARHRNVE